MSPNFDFAGALGGAGKGAAAGAVLGPVGAAVGGLVGLGLSIAPEIGKWLGGDGGEETARRVTNVIQDVAGTSDPDLAAAAIGDDPAKAMSLRVQLAHIAADREADWRQHELDTLKAHIADTQDARDMSVEMARERHPLAYGAAVVTLLILGLFAYTLIAASPVEADMRETLKVLAVAAATYWIGSSRGSASKELANRSADAPRN